MQPFRPQEARDPARFGAQNTEEIALNIPSIDFDLGEDVSLLRDTLRAFV